LENEYKKINIIKDLTNQSINPYDTSGMVLNNQEKKCVLIYDDDLEILFLCKAILSKSNYRIETLTRCENVIEDITRLKPDIILMDLWIPEIGGEKATDKIKKNSETQHIPILIFSANPEIETICKKVNANGYIEKPFDIISFKETIKENIL